MPPRPPGEYYRLVSTFTKTVRSDYDVNLDPAGYRKEKEAFEKEHAPLVATLQKFEAEQLPQRFEIWRSSSNRREPVWHILDVGEAKSAGCATLTRQEDGSFLVEGKNPDFDTYTFTTKTDVTGITTIRLEALAHASMVKGGPGRAGNGNFALTNVMVTASPVNGQGQPVTVKLGGARATFEQKGLPIAAAIDGDTKSAWAVDPQFGKDQSAIFLAEQPFGFPGGTVLTITLKFENNNGHNIGRPRLSVTGEKGTTVAFDAPARPERVTRLITTLSGGLETLTEADRKAVLAWYRTVDSEWLNLNRAIQEHRAKEPKPKLQKAMICSEGVSAIRTHTQGGDYLEQTHFLRRGDPNNKAEVATQGFLTVLMRAPEKEKHWQETPPKDWRTLYQRRALANWMTDVENGAGALLARVIVNRLWQHEMGRGIVATPSDFGTQGERPTHPELLDYLATELIRSGWRLKAIHQLILTSATYQQSAAINPANQKRDPDNRLCWRHPRRRLEAEVIRDSMLSVSGLLDTTMFGAGTLDESMKRRSLYFFIKRSRLIPTMMLFDAPDSLQSIGLRQATIIAPQALLLLNNRNVREYAVALSRRVAPKSDTPLDVAITAAYRLVLGRHPAADERTAALAFVSEQERSYAQSGQSEARNLALADFCQALFGLNEFVYVD